MSKKRLFLCLSPLMLAACGQERPVIVLPPAELTTCADEPDAPNLPGQDQQAERDMLMLDYVLNLRSAYGDCRSRVDGLAVWRETAGANLPSR